MWPDNLYVHFPFCRRKCTYCVLHSRCGVSPVARVEYVSALAQALQRASAALPGRLKTIYFGGGSPALCDLAPLAEVLRPHCAADTEFTVELHPLDVTEDVLRMLKRLGVNRISMGVQSLDDATLADMGRGYTSGEAARAFARVKRHFDNAGIDLIVGYPGDRTRPGASAADMNQLRDWGLRHCSVYSLQLEEGSILHHRLRRGNAAEPAAGLPSDDETLDRLREVASFLSSIGLDRYEISNYAADGFACRHNLSVWRGEDYLGLGEGACGRVGLLRTRNLMSLDGLSDVAPDKEERVSADFDRKERRLFRLRTREGLETEGFPEWRPILDRFAAEGLVCRRGSTYVLTPRGTEVCDAILAELV